jgi:acetylornithine/succinyldiaminopimelate/putrescine aminotransferase
MLELPKKKIVLSNYHPLACLQLNRGDEGSFMFGMWRANATMISLSGYSALNHGHCHPEDSLEYLLSRPQTLQ